MSEVAPDALRGLIQFGRMPYLGRVVSVLLLWCCVIVVLINLRFFQKKGSSKAGDNPARTTTVEDEIRI